MSLQDSQTPPKTCQELRVENEKQYEESILEERTLPDRVTGILDADHNLTHLLSLL